MYVKQSFTCLLLMLLAFSSFTFTFADTTDTPFVDKPTDDSRLLVTNELKSGNDAQMEQAVTQIKAWFSIEQVPRELYLYWVPSLIGNKRYQDAADLSLAGALTRPDIRFMTPLMAMRARALLALGDSEQALEAAKSYYNVCYMKNTNDAVQLVAECFVQLYPKDHNIGRRFINEQTDVMNGGTTDTEPMLNSVKIDATLYNDAIQNSKIQMEQGGKYFEFNDYANLLLTADRADEAQKIYMALYQKAITQDELNTAIEGIARSMRAEDGTVFRANAWLLSLQKQGQQKTASPSQGQ